MKRLLKRYLDTFRKYILTAKWGCSSSDDAKEVARNGNHKGCRVVSERLCPRAKAEVRHLLYFPPFSRWWVPSVTLLMTASKLCCRRRPSAHSPPLKHPCRGFLHREARGEGVKVKVWHGATDLLQQRSLLPGCSRSATWLSQVASDLTSTLKEPVGREAEIEKMKGTGKLGWKKGSEWRKGRLRGDGMKQSVQK